jgi:SAM-dependent methyltransferase
MMGGTALAHNRRAATRLFTDRVCVGRAIDIGAGPDPLRTDGFPHLRHVDEWDLHRGDATFMNGIDREWYDLVYSSHCLEHISDPMAAVRRWWELVKVGGHLVIVVPDEELYERFEWPPHRNSDHKHSYSTMTLGSPDRMPSTVRVQKLADLCTGGRLISLLRLEDGFDANNPSDQTAIGTCECGIELVIRKEAQS